MLMYDNSFQSIVSEDGASVYSASKEASNELPNVELSMRGAGT